MMHVEIKGREYRFLRVVSIHEDDDYVECTDITAGEILYEIRITEAGEGFLGPTAREIDVEVLLTGLAFWRGE